MTLADYQVSYNGVTVGVGCTFELFAIEGFDDFTARVGDATLPSLWGAQPSGVYVEERTITIGVQLADPADYDGTVDAAFVPAPQYDPVRLLPLHIKFPDREEMVTDCRVTRRSRARTPETEVAAARWWFELVAPDPRLYGAIPEIAIVGPYTASSLAIDSTTGAGSELAFDSTTGAASELAVDSTGTAAVGEQFAVNSGTVDAYPRLTFTTDADLSQWTLFNDTTGESVTFVYAMGPASELVADMAAVATGKVGTPVTTNGSSNYATWQPPRAPLRIAPGTNILRFIVDVGSSGSQCIADWSSAWL